jgi:hypothetical protein
MSVCVGGVGVWAYGRVGVIQFRNPNFAFRIYSATQTPLVPPKASSVVWA